MNRSIDGVRVKLILIVVAASICGCSNFNRTDRYRAMEQLEEIKPVVTISGAAASSEAGHAMERARLWLRNNSPIALRETGRDTIVSQPPPLSEFGYRVVRFDSANNVRLEVAQRGFTGYSDGAAARRLAWYMATGSDIDSTLPPFRPALTSYYFQFGGEGFFASLNLERLLLPHIVARTGVGMWVTNLLSGADAGMVVPLTVSWVSSQNQGLEVGAGASLFIGERYPIGEERVLGFASIGFRSVPLDGGMVLRVTFTPRYSFAAGRLLFDRPLFGVGLGHTL